MRRHVSGVTVIPINDIGSCKVECPPDARLCNDVLWQAHLDSEPYLLEFYVSHALEPGKHQSHVLTHTNKDINGKCD